MNIVVNPVDSNSSLLYSVNNSYKNLQKQALEISKVVYESLQYLTGAKESLTLQNLSDLSQTLNNENLTQNSAYKLVNNLISKFNQLSSDGETLTMQDFQSAVSFSTAQTYSASEAVRNILNNNNLNISDAVSQILGQENAATISFVNFMNSLSSENKDVLNNIGSKNSKEEKTEPTAKSAVVSNAIYYKNVTPDILKSHFEIAV